MEKAAKDAEILTKDAQNQLEKAKIDTQLEMLQLQREADAAVAEAEVLESAGGLQVLDKTGQSISEKVKVERTTEYVQSQLDLQKQSCSPHLPVSFPLEVESHGSYVKLCERAMEVSPLPPTCKMKGGSGASFPEPLKDEKRTRNSNRGRDAPLTNTHFGAEPTTYGTVSSTTGTG